MAEVVRRQPFGDSAGMPTIQPVLISFAAGLALAMTTAPVGVSGAVFLLPFQMSVLQVPNPAVTPTNLLFNIVAIPGALARYRTRAPLRSSPLTARLLAGTVPGVVAGAVIRVFLIPGPRPFRLLVAALLLPLGIWLCLPNRTRRRQRPPAQPSDRFIAALAVGVGIIGGIYGIGGGSLLSPILVGRGLPIPTVAPAALTSTFVTSIAGAVTYTILAATTAGHDIAPDWAIGIAAGAGGLIGGYLGARLQSLLPEPVLRTILGALAIATAALYAAQSLR